MKRNQLTTNLGLVCLLFTLGCGKDSDNTVSPTSSLTAKVDNVNWSATQGASIGMESGLTNLTGKANDGSVITITIFGQTTGTYVLDENSLSAGVYQEGTNLAFVSNQGNDPSAYVKITSINLTDSIMSGEFRFTAFRSLDGAQKNITEGKFTNIRILSSFPTGNTNYVKCKIDGQLNNSISSFVSVLNGSLLITGAFETSGRGLGFVLVDDIAVGEHDLGGINQINYVVGPSDVLYAKSGKINITKHDRTAGLIEGTFHGEVEDLFKTKQASITEGEFSVKY